jgi:hypothetical protein
MVTVFPAKIIISIFVLPKKHAMFFERLCVLETVLKTCTDSFFVRAQSVFSVESKTVKKQLKIYFRQLQRVGLQRLFYSLKMKSTKKLMNS